MASGRVFDVVFPVAFAVGYALIALWVHFKWFPIGDTGVESDFYQTLVGAAQELWNGNLSVAGHPTKGPFYSVALVFVHLFGGDWYTNGVVLNAMCALGSIVVLYRLLLRVFGRWLAVAATLSTSLTAGFFVQAHKASTDRLFFLLCFLAIGSLLTSRRYWLPLIGAGVFSALAFLTRYNGAYLPVVTVFVLLFINPRGWKRRRRYIAVAVYVAVFVLVCAPWFLLSWVEAGTLLPTRNLRNITAEFYGGASAGDMPPGGFTSVGSLIAHDPLHFVTHYLKNIPRHLWFDVTRSLGSPTGILMAVGAVLLLLIPPTRTQSAFYSFGIGYFLSMCAVFWLTRFVFPVIPMYVALGFSWLVAPRGERRTRLGRAVSARVPGWLKRVTNRNSAGFRRCASVLVGVILLLHVLAIVRYERFYLEDRPLFILPAAHFLKRHAERAGGAERKTVLARKAHIAYYAGMEYAAYPPHVANSREFITSAVTRGVDYVVFSILEQTYHREHADWLARLDVEFGVERIVSQEKIMIYEIADWVDLEEQAGRSGLEARLARLRDLDRSGSPLAVLRACVEIYMLYSHNGKLDEAAEYLVRSFEAAAKMSNRDEADHYISRLQDELTVLALAYSRAGRDADADALHREALARLGRGPAPGD